MYKRKFTGVPLSFPKHYHKEEEEGRFYYYSKYTDPRLNTTILNAVNEWFDYMGDIVMNFANDLDDMERQDKRRHSDRGESRNKIIRGKVRSTVPKRINLL